MLAIGKLLEMPKQILFFSRLLLLMFVPSVMVYSSVMLDYPFLWWPIYGLFLICAFKLRDDSVSFRFINLYFIWEVISIVYGLYMSRGYWDTKLLVENIMIYSIPIVSYTFANKETNQLILSYFFKYAPIVAICLFPIASMSHFFGRIAQPFVFLLLFYLYLNKKYKLICIGALIVGVGLGFTDRSDNIRLIVALLIGLCGYYKFDHIRESLLKRLSLIFMVAPFILFALAVSGTFNVLNIGEEMGWTDVQETRSGGKKDIFGDSRTFVYEEVVASSIKHDYYICGHSLARGYETFFFRRMVSKAIGKNWNERGRCETGILNVFTYMGIIGVILISIVFINAIYKGVFKSNNSFIPIIGFYISFRWVYFWVEEYQKFDLSFIFLWIMIGMCLSPSFRSMTDDDFYNYLENLSGNNDEQNLIEDETVDR